MVNIILIQDTDRRLANSKQGAPIQKRESICENRFVPVVMKQVDQETNIDRCIYQLDI